jgi:magnesium chelatase family protein
MAGLPESLQRAPEGPPSRLNLAQVRGLETVKRGLEVAAPGGHSLQLVGPMGAGKPVLALVPAGFPAS